MKKFFTALVRGLFYIALYLAVSTLVSVIEAIGISAEFALSSSAFSALEIDEIVRAVTEKFFADSQSISLATSALCIASLAAVCDIRGKDFLSEISLKRISALSAGLCVLCAVTLSFFVSTIMEIIPIPESVMNEYMELSSYASSDNFVLMFFSTVVFAPLCEELMFRSMLYTRLRSGMPAWVAMILSGILFGMMHGQIVWIVYAAVLGVIIAFLFERYKSVVAGIVFHFIFNLLGAFAAPYITLDGAWLYIVCALSGLFSIGLLVLVYFKTKRPEKHTV